MRAREKRQSGLGTLARPTVLDTLAEHWMSNKVSCDLMSEASQAQARIIREAATTNNQNVEIRAEAIQAARDLSHRARPPIVAQLDHDDTGSLDGLGDRSTPRSNDSRRGCAAFSPILPNRSTNAHRIREMLNSASATAVSSSEVSAIVHAISAAASAASNRVEPVVASPVVASPLVPTRTKSERLVELQRLLADGLITQDEYATARASILREQLSSFLTSFIYI